MAILLLLLFGSVSAQVRNCDPLAIPSYGNVAYSSQLVSGTYPSLTVATLSCKIGFPRGHIWSTCFDSRWTPSELGTCPEVVSEPTPTTLLTNSLEGCPVAGTPARGDIAYSNGMRFDIVPHGTTATLTCRNGHRLDGPGSIACTNGSWIPEQIGTCANDMDTEEGCVDMQPRDGAEFIYSSQTAAGSRRPTFSTVQLRCPAGATVDGPATAVCISNAWNPAIVGTCRPDPSVGCFNMTAVEGGEISYSASPTGGYRPNFSKATLICSSGFVQGAESSTCSNGVWNPSTLGVCTAASDEHCHPLQHPQGGTVELSKGMDGFPVENGVIAKLRCDAGKYATGSTTAICSNGHWIPSSLGMCTDISNSAGLLSCNWVSAPHGMFLSWSPANFGGLILNGTTVRASCINRTPVSGVDELTCTNGAWQPSSFGTCGGKPGSNAGASCAPIAHSAGMVLVYRSGDRYRMGNVLHNLDHGTLLTVKCFNGTLSGSSSSSCADGSWYPTGVISCTS